MVAMPVMMRAGQLLWRHVRTVRTSDSFAAAIPKTVLRPGTLLRLACSEMDLSHFHES